MSGQDPTRRDVLSAGVRGAALLLAGGTLGAVVVQNASPKMVWQIDPERCIQCGKCATECVLAPSAVKCMHATQFCGYCKVCSGFLESEPNAINSGAENQLCPTNAIRRKRIEGDYYSYSIDLDKCIGCSKCVKGCGLYGNGSFFLQIDRKICVDCNQCSIARVCPSQAISRIPANQAYTPRTKPRTA